MADNNGQKRVIRLPHLIRSTCLVTINQVKHLLVGLRSLMGERCELRRKVLDNPLHRAVARWRPVVLSTDADRFTVDGGDSSAWLLYGQPLDNALKLWRQRASLSLVFSGGFTEASESVSAILLHPASQGAHGQPVESGDMGQRDAIVEKGTDEVKVCQRLRALGLRQGDQ